MDRSRRESTGINKSDHESAQIDTNRHLSTPIGAGCMQCRGIIGERHGYWNIKGRYHFVVVSALNLLCSLPFARYQVGQFVVPRWYLT